VRDRTPPPADDLPLTALRYAAGELSPREAAAFEARLAVDQAAREALGEAIRLSAAALQQPAPAPDPLAREVVRDALRPTLLSWLFPRRPYRGHPLAWAGLGGAVAAGLTVFGVWLGDRPADNPFPPRNPVDFAPVLPPDGAVSLPKVDQFAGRLSVPEPDPPAVAPHPRLVEEGGFATAEPESPAEADLPADRRTLAADAEEETKGEDRTRPGRPDEGKDTLHPDIMPQR
jgi:hypothetical protein